jgi:hypothetical protein
MGMGTEQCMCAYLWDRAPGSCMLAVIAAHCALLYLDGGGCCDVSTVSMTACGTLMGRRCCPCMGDTRVWVGLLPQVVQLQCTSADV